MSKSRKSNPVPYRLKPISTLRDISRCITQVRQIFSSYRKRARAAYIFKREQIKNHLKQYDGVKDYDAAKAKELKNWDDEAYCREQVFADQESKITVHMQKLMLMDDWTEKERVDTFNATVEVYNQKIRWPRTDMASGLESFEKLAYHESRAKARGKKSDGVIAGMTTRTSSTRVKGEILTSVKARYPWVTAKNKPRLIKVVQAYFQVAHRFPRPEDIYPYMLTAAGIPAAEVVGPWWSRSEKVKSPMDWIRLHGAPSDGLGHIALHSSSPGPRNYIANLNVDAHDHKLVDSVAHYYKHNKQVPSATWVRQRANELEEERKEAEVEEQVEDVESWLRASSGWRKNKDIEAPTLPEGWHYVAPSQAEKLCRMAQRDGLCVIDVITGLVGDDMGDMNEDEDEIVSDPVLVRSIAEKVCSLVIHQDPKIRTVVGLNEDGVCSDHHHCTGTNNEFDKAAWELFKR